MCQYTQEVGDRLRREYIRTLVLLERVRAAAQDQPRLLLGKSQLFPDALHLARLEQVLGLGLQNMHLASRHLHVLETQKAFAAGLAPETGLLERP